MSIMSLSIAYVENNVGKQRPTISIKTPVVFSIFLKINEKLALY